MANFIRIELEGGELKYVNLDQVRCIEFHPAGTMTAEMAAPEKGKEDVLVVYYVRSMDTFRGKSARRAKDDFEIMIKNRAP
jgi:hypothetical protein